MNQVGSILGFCLLFSSVLSVCLSAQSPDTIRLLQTVEISAPPIRQQSTGERQETWQPDNLQNHTSDNLGELLSMQSGVFVKSYGLGSSATTSIRGGSASHTQVIWNGLPVQNPMLGQLDFSLIPVGFVDKMTIAYGGNTATWGSGAIGGTIFLENESFDKQGFTLKSRSELGSFGWWDQQSSIQYAKGKVNTAIRYFHQQAVNDFSYSVSPVLPERKQTHAALSQDGLLHELYWNIKPNQQLSTHIWAQETERELPPRTTQNRSLAEQSDRFLRTAINWKRTGERSLLNVRGGLFREEQNYADPLANIDTENNFWKAIGEVEQAWHFSEKQKLQVGLNHTWLQSAAGAYKQSRQQNRSSIFAMFRQGWGNWEAQLNVRQEMVDGSLAPVVPSIGMNGKLTEWLLLRAKVSRNYRLPTLNDLYWQPGGNPDLRAEQGWSEELGLEYQVHPKNHLSFTCSTTAFNRNISDWIQWALMPGQPFFSPQNITKVWSRGLEQRVKLDYVLPKIKIQATAGFDFIQSTFQQSVVNPQFNKGDQLAYTPEYLWFGRFLLKWKQIELAYQHHYTGSVGTLSFTELHSYHLGQLHLNLSWKRKPFSGNLFFRIENVWDEDYEVIEYRAMPGRYFRTGVELEFN